MFGLGLLVGWLVFMVGDILCYSLAKFPERMRYRYLGGGFVALWKHGREGK
jgi:hypothetical protein